MDQFVSKINASALNITAVDNGGNSSSAAFTLTPGSGATITVTEDPTGNGQFGESSSHCIIEDVAGSETTVEFATAPFSFSGNFPWTIRKQSTEGAYDVTTS